mgnify:CR=1 FL=1
MTNHALQHQAARVDVARVVPTGATDLYRSLGFAPEQTFIAWRKPLEPG